MEVKEIHTSRGARSRPPEARSPWPAEVAMVTHPRRRPPLVIDMRAALQVDVVAVQMEVQSNGLVFAKMRAARCIWQQVLLFGARLSLSATVCSAWY